MERSSATPGQILQIIAKVLSAIPAGAYSFDEAEGLLSDGKLRNDLAALLRRHRHNGRVGVRVPSNAINTFIQLCCSFAYIDPLGDEVSTDLEQKNRAPDLILRSLIDNLTQARPEEAMSKLEIISFEVGTPQDDVLGQLKGMGCRPADACEAAGFLQARGKSFRNVGKQQAPYTFQIIGEKTMQTLEFSTHDEPGRNRSWAVTGFRYKLLTASLANEILVAKL